jgi:hypothetical protein
MRRVILAAALAAVTALLVTGNGLAGGKNTCPVAIPAGSTVNGGLVVTGDCVLTNVTVHGGVLITSTGGLELENSSVDGGINVQAGGELDSGHTLSSGTDTFNPSTINGGVQALGPMKDLDLDNASINGNVSISGNAPGFAPYICGSSINGSVSISNVVDTPGFHANIGDPGEVVQSGPVRDCPGNTIHGSVSVSNVQFLEIEGNTITGSVFIDSSTVDVRGNTIGGNVQCTGATAFTDDGAADATLAPNPCS